MGCDIHLYKEKLVRGQWVTADKWTPYDYGDGEAGMEVDFDDRFHDRNYQLFGLLAKGVRSEHEFSFYPRGVPFNLSKEVEEEKSSWDGDGHNHSYLYLFELKEIREFVKSQMINIQGMKDKDQLKEFMDSINSDDKNWGLLWPYCGWASADNYVEFNVDVPAALYFGDCLNKIIDGFNGVDGDNHRIVFWFDN